MCKILGQTPVIEKKYATTPYPENEYLKVKNFISVIILQLSRVFLLGFYK